MNSTAVIKARGLAMGFGRGLLFSNIDIELEAGSSLAIRGPNGSGKTTLLNIISGLKKPSRGTVEFHVNGNSLEYGDIPRSIGYVGPSLNLYDAMTGLENIQFACRTNDTEKIRYLLEYFNLHGHGNKAVQHYSSGMKQRLKLITALVNDPPVLALDEPGTSLDRDGRDRLYSFITSIREHRILIIATNEKEEGKLCSREIGLA